MRIGILADSHDQVERVERAVAVLRAAGAGALFHCGDLLGPGIVRACSSFPSYFVLGNNDESSRRLIAAGGNWLGLGGEVCLAGKRIAMTHGHDRKEVKRLLSFAPDYLLLGHSHRKRDEKIGGTRVINPGALHRANPWSVALLDLKTDELRFLELPVPARAKKSRPTSAR